MNGVELKTLADSDRLWQMVALDFEKIRASVGELLGCRRRRNIFQARASASRSMKNTSSVVFEMDRVHDAMDEWRHNEGGGTDEQQARKEGIRRNKQLACVRRDRINRPHTAKDHRGVHKGVYPRQATEVVVAQNPDPEGNPDRYGRQSKEPHDSPEKAVAGQERVGTVFKHAVHRNSPARLPHIGGAA